MSPEAQRIAIAEACGYEWITATQPEDDRSNTEYPRGTRQGGYSSESLPDYLSDLNSMHEAEKVLTEEQQHEYGLELLRRVYTPIQIRDGAMDEFDSWDLCRAATSTAAQRAEAFLHVIGKWDDSK